MASDGRRRPGGTVSEDYVVSRGRVVSQRVGAAATGFEAWYSRSAMSGTRLTLLCAFAGGCFSNAVLFGLWRAADGAGDSAVAQQRGSHHVVELAQAASGAPRVAQPSELVAAAAADHGHAAAPEATPSPAASDLDSGGTALAGSAVSQVLARLETAYRERVAARAPAQVSLTQERATAAASAPADNAAAATQAAPGALAAPTQRVTEVIPAVTVAAAPEPWAPAVLPPAAVAPQVAAAPARVAQEVVPPTEIHYGDVNQNTYITNVRQGDVYLIQMQQIAMLQYMQLLGMSGVAAPARHGSGGGRQRGLSSGITNPDNPWGFRFAPPNLVR